MVSVGEGAKQDAACDWLRAVEHLVKVHCAIDGNSKSSVVGSTDGGRTVAVDAEDPGVACIRIAFNAAARGASGPPAAPACCQATPRGQMWGLELEAWGRVAADGAGGCGPNGVIHFVDGAASRPGPSKGAVSAKGPPVLSSSLKRHGSKSLLGQAVKTWNSRDLEESSACKQAGKAGTTLAPKGPGWRPLCVAAHEGRVELAAMLIASGADANLPCETDACPSPLHLAAAAGHTVSENCCPMLPRQPHSPCLTQHCRAWRGCLSRLGQTLDGATAAG